MFTVLQMSAQTFEAEGDTSGFLVPGCTASRGEDSYFAPSHWFYCAFDSDHYHDGFIVPEIWQTKSRKWLGVTQGDLERHVVERVRENCVCV